MFAFGRIVGGVAAMVAGAFVLGSTLLVMNRKVHGRDAVKSTVITAMKVEKKKKPPAKKRLPKPKPKPRRSRRALAPRPSISSNLAGLGVGLPMFQIDEMDQLGGDLLENQAFTEDMVLTEEAVDKLPVAKVTNAPPKYPARARAKGIEGRLLVRFVIGADGGVRKVQVVEAEPEGVFEDAVLSVARGWSFEPAIYNGVAVQMTLTMPIAMKLN